MAIKLSFKKNISENKIKNYILFSDENFKIMGINAISLAKQSNLINKIIANNKSKDKNFLLLNINSTQNVILIKLQSKISSFKNEKLGAEFYSFIKSNSIFSSTFIDNNISITINFYYRQTTFLFKTIYRTIDTTHCYDPITFFYSQIQKSISQFTNSD